MNNTLQAEQSVIGAIIMDPEVVMAAAAELEPRDFQTSELRTLFETAKGLYLEGKPIDVVTVLDRVGESYKGPLVQACELTPTIANHQDYIRIVRDNSRRLQAYEKASQLSTALLEGEELDVCQDMAASACEALAQTKSGDTVSASEGYYQFCCNGDKPREYIRTGLSKLDKYAYISAGDYIVLGARPSVGKTALTLQLALTMAKSCRVAYFSLETAPEKLFDRMIANYTETPLEQIKRGQIRDWGKVAQGYGSFSKLDLHVVGAAGWTVGQIRAKTAQLQARVIFVDYLSLVQGEGRSLYERVTNISMGLHTLAQQSKVAVFVLSQLNRAGAGEPDMTSLRESGQIEQDADVILLLHDPHRDERGGPSTSRRLVIAKNKEGSTGAFDLYFDGEIQRFRELDTRYTGG